MSKVSSTGQVLNVVGRNREDILKQVAFDLVKISIDRVCSLDFLQLQEAELCSLKLPHLMPFTIRLHRKQEEQESSLSSHPGGPHGESDTSSGSMRAPIVFLGVSVCCSLLQ